MYYLWRTHLPIAEDFSNSFLKWSKRILSQARRQPRPPCMKAKKRYRVEGREENTSFWCISSFFLQEMGLKIISNTNIRKPRVCPTTPSTTMLQEKRMFTSRPMLMFGQTHESHNSKHLPTVPSYRGCLVFQVKAVLGLSWESELAVTANGGERAFPGSKPVVLLWGCLGLTASGSETLVGCLDPRSDCWGEGMVAFPMVPTSTSKAQVHLTFEMEQEILKSGIEPSVQVLCFLSWLH